MNRRDLTGKRFGRLLVKRYSHSIYYSSSTPTVWECVCDCGSVTLVIGGSLSSGHTASCGCYGRTHSATHNLSRSKEYKAWRSMKERCLNPKHPSFLHYGGRGITISERWMTFSNFIEDMGPCQKGMSLDRINNNGGYELSNCRWADAIQQCNNKRTNVRLHLNGKTMTVAEWASELGIKRKTLARRIHSGWPLGKALFTPVRSAI